MVRACLKRGGALWGMGVELRTSNCICLVIDLCASLALELTRSHEVKSCLPLNISHQEQAQAFVS